jgi:hypothetical protein
MWPVGLQDVPGPVVCLYGGVGAAVGRRRADVGPPVRRCHGHGTAKCSARWSPTCTVPCTGEHTRSTHSPQTRRGPLAESSNTPYDLGFCGAPGRIRTCGHRIRSSLVSRRHVSLHTVSCHSIRSAVPPGAVWCRLVPCQYGTAEHKRSTHSPLMTSDGILVRSSLCDRRLGTSSGAVGVVRATHPRGAGRRPRWRLWGRSGEPVQFFADRLAQAVMLRAEGRPPVAPSLTRIQPHRPTDEIGRLPDEPWPHVRV